MIIRSTFLLPSSTFIMSGSTSSKLGGATIVFLLVRSGIISSVMGSSFMLLILSAFKNYREIYFNMFGACTTKKGLLLRYVCICIVNKTKVYLAQQQVKMPGNAISC